MYGGGGGRYVIITWHAAAAAEAAEGGRGGRTSRPSFGTQHNIVTRSASLSHPIIN